MPDGTALFYSVPQEECPACDFANWGWQWNKDFPLNLLTESNFDFTSLLLL